MGPQGKSRGPHDNVVLINSNPATIMTDRAMADEIYLEPLTEQTVMRVIEKEKPDSLLAGLGGQTGLTIAMQLNRDGFLDSHGVKLIGTNADAIEKAEDRKLFKETMESIGQPCIPSDIAVTVEEAVAIADRIGYPVIVRPAFTLGGAGGGIARTEKDLRSISANGLLLSPITQVLIEKFIGGWKEIEFEVMRDHAGNVITICAMENMDPVGIHTGDSIVVAPTVTLADKEFQMLRSAALHIINALGIEGGCNIQFALDPVSFDYAVIEVNPRVSRSSALASKATGYPIAKVTAKIALGYTLDEIRNDVTGKTCACFEPTVDYIVVKMPKWPFDKFVNASRKLGTQMKATGEVMAIAPSFEMAIMKAVRGAEIKIDTLRYPGMRDAADIRERMAKGDDLRLFAVFEALRQGVSIDEIFDITKIDRWFLGKIKHLVDFEQRLEEEGLTDENYLQGKKYGYTDRALARLTGAKIERGRLPVYKMVDTCGGEFAAETPYFYSTMDDVCEAREMIAQDRSGREKIIVLGGGPIRIGQGIEFDYSSVHCAWALRELGYEVIIINNNPETVSTDFDTADRLYFEPLTPEDVLGVIAVEKPVGVVVAFGGQTAINLTKTLSERGIPILGTSAEGIDIAEDRERFDQLLETIGIRRPQGHTVMTMEQAYEAADSLGYPVLLRPSYVIGGQNMTIAHNPDDVTRYMKRILAQGIENPVLIDKYMSGVELEVDVISDGVDVLIPGVMQHVERAGVHSGDSIAVYPPMSINDAMLEIIVRRSTQLALALGTKGLVNIQYLIYMGDLYVIEVNPRASRTIPYISKVTGVPMVDLATRVMIGQPLASLGYGTGLYKTPPYTAVKVPVFSFEKLNDVDSALGPEMKSTGEALGIGSTLTEALFKGLISAGFSIGGKPRKGVLISVGDQDKLELVSLAKKLSDLGTTIYATAGTARAIAMLGVDVEVVDHLYESDQILTLLDQDKLDYLVITDMSKPEAVDNYIRMHRFALLRGVAVLTSLDTANALADIIASRFSQQNTELINILDMRSSRQKLRFFKMQGTGDDYIFFDNFAGQITCPEALAINMCDRHYGIGGDGIVLLERSPIADIRMRIFNRDGSEGRLAGNSIRCVAKYAYDSGMAHKNHITVETMSGIKDLTLYTIAGKVNTVRVAMGAYSMDPKTLPVSLDGDRIVNRAVKVAGGVYRITCLSIGNPHCVIFSDRVDGVKVPQLGPLFENDPIFPERVNTEFIRVVNKSTIKMRVWERGNGETWACGTGACAAAIAAIENGLCQKDTDITVKLRGGDLVVRVEGDQVYLTGDAVKIYEGEVEY